MGKLALYGAIAGGGASLQDLGKMKHEKEMSDLDAERASGLARLKSSLSTTAEQTQHDRDRAEEVSDAGAKREQEDLTREDEQTHKVDIQTQKDLAAMDRTLISSAASSGLADRFKFHTDTTQKFNTKTREIDTETITTVMDDLSGIPYSLVGNKFVPQGTDPEAVEDAPQSHITALYENASEEAAEAFLRQYNYLPRDFMRNLSQFARTNSSSRRRPTGATNDTQ